MEPRSWIWIVGGGALLLTLAYGCSGNRASQSPDRENAVLRDSLDRQADLNKAILQQNREVVEASRKLVEFDAQSRKEFVVLQQEIQKERIALVRQQELIEGERRQLAQERNRDPIVAAAITNAAFLAAICLTLVFCWFVLRRLGADSDTETLRDLLVAEVITGKPFLLPLVGPQPPPLPAPDNQPKTLTAE